ncbi:MAG: choice-of-anchor D domain-containing protein [Verrucomicrobia bacterium]|nr:choice-of-anchor D domain-containing protein [Verrucomicrobiota bacterium]
MGPIALADRATIDPTKTQIAMPLSKAPKIDGVIDTDEWNRAGGFASDFWRVGADPNLADGVLGGVIGVGPAPADNDDLSFRIYVGYDSQNLYVAVRVKDSVLQEDSAAADSKNGNTWEDDSVEVFVDGDNGNATRWAASQLGGQYVITVNNAYRENEAGNPGYGATAAWFAKTSRNDTGYDAEFRISLATLGNPKPGDIIGFTVAVNDDDDGGGTDRQIAWVGAAHEPKTYGNLMLNGRAYTAPKTAAPAIDGTLNASEYAGAAEIKIDGFNGIYDITSGDNTWETTDHSFSAWVVHDAEAIYVAVRVTDDKIVTDTAMPDSEDGSTWEDDSVEIFFDPNNSKDSGRGREPYEGQYVMTANGAWRDNEANNPTFGKTEHWFAATAKTATGFAIEFKVKKSAILNPADGTSIGFHIAINDDDGSLPSPKMQLGWSGYAHAEFTYGTLTLGGTSTPTAKVAITGTTDFGAAAVGGARVERTFTLANVGTASLNLSGTPRVAVVGPQASDFTVLTQPTSPIAPGGNSTFTIGFSPAAAGARNATVSIANNGEKNPHDFAIVGTGTVATQGFQLVENFQQTTPGNLNGQRGWRATLAQVKADPTQAANRVASFEGAGEAGANLPLLIPQGTTATLFFRAYSEADTTLVDWFAGMSDVAVSGVGAFGDFEVQIGYSGSQILDTLRVRDGTPPAGNVAAGEFLPQTWYKIWAVIDNTADTTEVFIQGGTLTAQTQVAATATGNTSFKFRNSGAAPVANDLIRFFVKSGTATLPGPALLDDIYLATGKVLTDPTTAAPLPSGKFTGIKVEASNVIITFTGSGVQSASAVNGPWTDVAGTSPLTVPIAGAPKFYRFKP